MAEIDDQRETCADSQFVVFTDTFLGGWGGASGGRSLLAFAVKTEDEIDNVLRAGGNRTDMIDGWVCPDLKNLHAFACEGDHLAIRDQEGCSRWYKTDGFNEEVS